MEYRVLVILLLLIQFKPVKVEKELKIVRYRTYMFFYGTL